MAQTAQDKDRALYSALLKDQDGRYGTLHALGAKGYDIARTLRRAQLTLHRWAEEECNGTIQRDGDQGDGRPFRVWAQRVDGSKYHRSPVPDREAGALRRIAKVCKAAGLHYYHQTDPRGCALYVSTEPLTSSNYNRGVACL